MKQVKLWMLAVILALCGVTAARAEKTAQVLWCNDATTLYFINSETLYAEGGTYQGQTVTNVWSGTDITETGDSDPGWATVKGSVTWVVFDETFAEVRPTSCEEWFAVFSKVSEFAGLQYLNTSEVTSTYGMFTRCTSLTTLDVGGFDMSKVTDARRMFFGCSSLTAIYCDSEWSLANNHSGMFTDCTRLRGAVAYDSSKTDGTMANPSTGYFTGRFDVTVAEIAGGTIEVSDLRPYAGTTVTFTVTLAGGGTLDNISVSGDETGNEVTLTDLGGGKYSFVMPSEPVTVGKQMGAFAMWSEPDATLYFYYGAIPAVGGAYHGAAVTNVWSGTAVTATGWGKPGWSSISSSVQKVVFDESFATARPTSCYWWFSNFQRMKTIEGIEHLNTSEVTVMNSMFNYCLKLKTLDVNGFNMSKVTNTTTMFQNCSSLTTIYCISTWNTEGLAMFYGCDNLRGAVAYDSDKASGGMANPLTGYFTCRWDVIVADGSAVKVDNATPYTNETVTVSVNDDNYNISDITVRGKRTGTIIATTDDQNRHRTFQMPAEEVIVSATVTPSNVPIAVWCEGDATLYFARGAVPAGGDAFNGQIANGVWSNRQITSSSNESSPAWYGLGAKVKRVVFDPSFATARPKSCHQWFGDFTSLTEIVGLEYLNTSEVTNINSMFKGCTSLTTIDVNGFDVSKVDRFDYVFMDCDELTTIYCDKSWEHLIKHAWFYSDFKNSTKLVGAVPYDESQVSIKMANPTTGYFTAKWSVSVDETMQDYVTVSNPTPYTNEYVTITSIDVETITVTGNRTGGEVAVTDNGDGTFTFKMPAEAVTVSGQLKVQPFVFLDADDKNLYFFTAPTVPQVGEKWNDQYIDKVWSGDIFTATSLAGVSDIWGLSSSVSKVVTKVVIDKSFAKFHPISCIYWFGSLYNVTEIEGLEYLDMSGVTNAFAMFNDCHSLTSLDLRTFDMSQVTNAAGMFYGCKTLTTIYCDDNWEDVWQVIPSTSMFEGCSDMFKDCPMLKGAVAYDETKTDGAMANPLTGYFTKRWNLTLNVNEGGTVSLSPSDATENGLYTNETGTLTITPEEGNVCNLTLTNSTTGETIDYAEDVSDSYTFTMPAGDLTIDCQFGQKTPVVVWSDGDATLRFGVAASVPAVGSTYQGQTVTSVWSGTQVTDIGWGTPGWNSLGSSVQKVVFDESFATVRPTSCNRWFTHFSALQTIEGLEYLNTSEVNNMNSMFYGCWNLTTLNLNTFDTGKVGNATTMFGGCSSLTTIYCDNTWNIEASGNMFFGCTKLLGAVAYSSDATDGAMANPLTGYFTGRNVTVSNGEDNAETLAKYSDGERWNVTLSDRTLYKDDSWNTLTLPFAVESFSGTPLDGATVMALESASYANGTLTLYFQAVEATEAGVPYIVKWAAGKDIANPKFTNVAISNVLAPKVCDDLLAFTGTYKPVTLEKDDRQKLYLSTANRLYYPTANVTVGSFRAYFELDEGYWAGDRASEIKSIRLNFDGETTDIEAIQNSKSTIQNEDDAWYDLDGRRLTGKPTQRGIYVKGGKKIVIK